MSSHDPFIRGPLSAEERALPARHLEKQASTQNRAWTIPRRRQGGSIPLSFAQERLWFLEQIEPGEPVRHMNITFRLTGKLDVESLERALHEIVRRHESLRTTFAVVAGRLVQIIAPTPASSLSFSDLRSLPSAEREAEARRRVLREIERPFDMARGPLFRANLWRLGEQQHVLNLTMHHIVSDGWSQGILARELSTLYGAFSRGEPHSLPELPIQYADYAVWQREWLTGPALQRQLAYWRDQLVGAPPLLDLPADFLRPMVQSHRGARERLLLPPELARALTALSRRERASLFMTLLAAFEALLFRLTGQADLVVGVPIAGRILPEVEGLIGLFLNSLPLRTILSDDPTFLELLDRVRNVALDAYDHQDLPFERMLEELQPERNRSRTPVFQVFFNMLEQEERQWALPGLDTEPFPGRRDRANFDLTVYVRRMGGQLRIQFAYSADLFSAARMAEMANQFQHLLWQIAEAPEQRVSQLSLVTPAAAKVLPDPTVLLSDRWYGPVHERVAHWARETPEQVALVDRHERWTYATLDQRTNQLAHHLRASGIQAQDVVAIYGQRGAALVWAILGVLKAGAAFLLLDPNYPALRLIEQLRTAKPRGWIQFEAAGPLPTHLQDFLATSPLAPALHLSLRQETMMHSLFAGSPTRDPGVSVGPDDLACVVFTSGSTGAPKGIQGRHSSLSHFLPWQAEELSLGPSDRFSLLSGLAHDPLQREIFTALWVGAAIHVPDSEVFEQPGALADWMARERITFAHLTPPLARLLTEGPLPAGLLSDLRRAWFVGDVLSRQNLERLHALAPDAVCVNTYGTTETQRAVSYDLVGGETDGDWSKPLYPLGRGIPDVQLLVLTQTGHLAGVGELGEIYVRSPHLARGYVGDEELTRERFMVNPFTGLRADRLYRTGDLGRYLPDGRVEYAGRGDRQVKIRGFRVELSEIEAVLAGHPAVQAAAVAVMHGHSMALSPFPSSEGLGNDPNQVRVAAYVVSQGGSPPSSDDLRRYLAQRLPEYMVPAVFTQLDRLPLTPNRKVDYAALPVPDLTDLQSGQTFVEPHTPLEVQLAEIWQEVLGVERVGIHDTFVGLGGYSLLSIRVLSLMQARLAVRLDLADLLFKTLGELATMCELILYHRGPA